MRKPRAAIAIGAFCAFAAGMVPYAAHAHVTSATVTTIVGSGPRIGACAFSTYQLSFTFSDDHSANSSDGFEGLLLDGGTVISNPNGSGFITHQLDGNSNGTGQFTLTILVPPTSQNITLAFDGNFPDSTPEATTIFDCGQPGPSNATLASIGRSAGAAFGRASNSADNYITQTQIQNRLIHNDLPSGPQAGLNGGGDQMFLSGGGAQLATAYGEGIRKPGKYVWHSKNIIKTLRRKQVARLQAKEQQALGGIVGRLGVSETDELVAPQAFKTPFDFWAAGGYTRVDNDRIGNVFNGDLFFGRTGFDYLVSSNFLIGGFAGYDEGRADFKSFSMDLDSKGLITGGYFGLKMTSGMTGLPVNIVIDGQASHGWLDYDVRAKGLAVRGSFDANRFSTSINVTAVILQAAHNGGTIRWLPKLGLNYVSEDQDAYSDSAGTAVASQKITLGQFVFGGQVFLPISKRADFFTRVEGQWDFDGAGLISTSTGGTYKPDDFGVVVGMGIRAAIANNMTLRIEGAAEGIGRQNYDQFTGSARIDYRF